MEKFQLLEQACLSGVVQLLRTVVGENSVDILGHKFQQSSNTALHLASRLGHRELVAEILRLRPELVRERNDRSETPLHEACREGHVKVVNMLMEVDLDVVYLPNCVNERGLLLACAGGHSAVAELLLTRTTLLQIEEEGFPSSLHAAAIGGHTDIVRHILEIRPDFYVRRDGYGRTPLQLAVINGRFEVIDEILKAIPESSRASTVDGDGLLHLGIKSDKFGSVTRILESTCSNINSQDSDGNTILHLATSKGISVMVENLLTRSGVAVNTTNNDGFTALDFVHDHTSQISKLLRAAGGMRGVELKMVGYPLKNSDVGINRKSDAVFTAIDLADHGNNYSSRSSTSSATRAIMSRCNSGIGENRDPSPAISSRTQNSIMTPLSRKKGNKEFVDDLRNARNTIIIVAVLIASLSFAAGINPPGGVHQDSDKGVPGKSVVGNTPAFIVFVISNEIALFLSLAIVAVLVSVIPFQDRFLTKLLVLTYGIMCVSLSFMAVAYMAATWVIIPTSGKSNGVMWVVLAVGGGTIFVTIMVVRHWISKRWSRMLLICTLSSPDSLGTDISFNVVDIV